MMGYRYAEKVYALLDRLERQLSPQAHRLRLVTNKNRCPNTLQYC